MTDRRTFLGAVAVAGVGGFGLTRAVRKCPVTLEFFALRSNQTGDPGLILGGSTGRLGTPERVDRGVVKVGHFHGLAHEGGGRVAYLYEATVTGPHPRRGLVKLADATAVL